MNINGEKVTLRAIEEEDLQLLHQWANDPVTRDGVAELHFPSSMEFHKEWFQNIKKDMLNQRYIVDVPGKGAIGLTSIMNIDWRNRHAWHGLVIGEADSRGRGYGVDAIMTTVRYAFEELNLERLDGSMVEYNEVSLQTYCGKTLGWKEEGRRRNYYFRKGRYWDQIVVGITRQDYLELVKGI